MLLYPYKYENCVYAECRKDLYKEKWLLFRPLRTMLHREQELPKMWRILIRFQTLVPFNDFQICMWRNEIFINALISVYIMGQIVSLCKYYVVCSYFGNGGALKKINNHLKYTHLVGFISDVTCINKQWHAIPTDVYILN